MTVIGVSGAKGGVGTSFIAANLASIWSETAAGVIVDAVPVRGTIDLLLDVETQRTWQDLEPVASELEVAQLDRAAALHGSGLKVLSAPEGQAEGPSWELLKALDTVTTFVIVDYSTCSGSQGPSYHQLRRIDLLVSTSDILSMRAARRLVSDKGNGRQYWGLVVNQWTTEHPAKPIELADALGLVLVGVIPFAPEEAWQQVQFGVPMPECNGGVRSCFEEMIGRLGGEMNSLAALHRQEIERDGLFES
jgi:Flp pilus assembly CpaE family ATPase